MNRTGVFVAPGQLIGPDGALEGDPPDSTMLSLWVSGLASPFVTWGERVEEVLYAEQSGDPNALQGALNKVAELYSDIPPNAPAWTEVRDKAVPYRLGEVPREVIRLVAGVDVQKNRIMYVIRGFGSRGSSWLVQAGELYGRTDEDAVWDALADLLIADHAGLRVEKALVDSGFRPDKPSAGDVHKVYEFCRRWDWLAYPTKGRPTQLQPLVVKAHEVKPDGKKRPFSVQLITVDSDFFKSLVHSRLRTPIGSPGALYVPMDVTEDYCRQLVSEVREVQEGRPVWIQISEHNHFLDCEALCAAAGRLLNVERIPEGVLRDWDGDATQTTVAPESEAEEDTPAAPAPAPAIAAKDLRAALRDRMTARATRLIR